LPAAHTASWPARAWSPSYLSSLPALRGRLLDLGREDATATTLDAYLSSFPAAENAYIFDARVLDDPSLSAAVEQPLSPAPPPPFPPIPALRAACYLYHITTLHALRPCWRWLLVGRPGVGFGCHVDPHATHAWNTLLHGRKRWALLPPDTPPEVAAPDPAAPARAWFATQLPRVLAAGVEPLLLEQAAGETVLIPAGWWHVAETVGEETSVAVTANFMDRCSFELELEKLAKAAPAAAAAWAQRVAAAGLPFSPQG
jgi:hypothetical protein